MFSHFIVYDLHEKPYEFHSLFFIGGFKGALFKLLDPIAR